MKNSNVKWEWIVFFVALVILLLAMLTMCGGRGQEPQLQAPPETTQEATAPPVTTVPTEAPTEAIEETTVPETTEETIPETTAPPPPAPTIPPADEDEDEDKKEEEKVEIPVPGTEKNPYVEVLPGDDPVVTSVKIPTSGSIHYLIDGSAESILTIENANATVALEGTTHTADTETGILTVDLSRVITAPVLAIGNGGEEQSEFLLNFSDGIGTAGNPQVLEDIGEIPVELPAEDTNGYHYIWTPDTDGTVTLTTETEGLEIIVTIGETVVKLSDIPEGDLTIEVANGEPVVIQVIAIADEGGKYPALTGTVAGTVAAAPGTEANPEPLKSVGRFSVKLEAGDTDGHWYSWNASFTGTLRLTVNKPELDIVVHQGENVSRLSDSEGTLVLDITKDEQIIFQMIAIADAAGNYPAVSAIVSGMAVHALGTLENPAPITTLAELSGEMTAEGYCWIWTAGQDGTATLWAENPEETAIDLMVTNLESGATATLSEMETTTVSAEVEKNQQLLIQAVMLPQETALLTQTSAQILLKGEFAEAPGTSAENPLVLESLSAPVAVALDAGESFYLSAPVAQMDVSSENARGVTLTYGEIMLKADYKGTLKGNLPDCSGEEPMVIVTAGTPAEFALNFAYPLGHEKNPAQLVMGENLAVVHRNAPGGYLLVWTADCDGELTITLPERGAWQYRVENVTEGTSGENHTSADEPLTPSETIRVKAGDVVHVVVNTFDSKEPAVTPAGQVKLTAGFFDPLLGTEAKPIVLISDENVVNSITVPAGETRYYTASSKDMRLTLQGSNVTLNMSGEAYVPAGNVLTVECEGENILFTLTNEMEKDAVCTISFSYPLGHPENPAKLVMGENKAVLKENCPDGYVFGWTAQCSGELTVSFRQEELWQYRISNETQKTCTSPSICGTDTAAVSQTVTVTEGDEIRVIVNTYDPETDTHTPAGEVTFEAGFLDPTLGTEENPIVMNRSDLLEVAAGQTRYYTAKAQNRIFTLVGSRVKVTYNGTDYLPEEGVIRFRCADADTFAPQIFAVTNLAQENSVFSVSFAFPMGHFENPMELLPEENEVTLEKGAVEGVYFLWKAEADGTLTITMEEDSHWQYVINNLTTGESGTIRLSDDTEPVLSETVTVAKGDEIQIMVNSYDPDSPHNPPGGVLRFLAVMTPEK